MYHFGFIIEQVLGHLTHSQNLQKNIAADDVQAEWGLIHWQVDPKLARIPLYNSNWTMRAGLRARRALTAMQRSAPLDAVFFHTQVTATLAQDWMERVPALVSLDATPRQYDRLGAFYEHTPGPAWLEHWKWKLNRDAFSKAHRLVTWSEWARQGLVEEYETPAEKIVVIPPGVNIPLWQRTAPYPARRGKVRVLFVGGNLERKGGLLLLNAFHHLRAQGLELELHLVTRDSVGDIPGVFVYQRIQPNSPELVNLYHQSDIFCLPTYGDCLPMVLSEAAAAGLPAISTRVGAIEEVVRDGETGLIIPPGDEAALVTALGRLVRDASLRARMSTAAAQLACHTLDAKANALRLIDLMKQVADEERMRRTR